LLDNEQKEVSMKAKLVLIHLPASDKERGRQFYSQLLGMDLAVSFSDNVPSYHIPISYDGIFLSLDVPYDEGESGATLFWAVDNLAEGIQEVEAIGGQLVHGPFDLTISPRAMDFYMSSVERRNGNPNRNGTVGSCAILKDPVGNMLGLIQLDESAHVFYGVGDHWRGLSEEQIDGHLRTVEAGKRFTADPTAAL
jgi:predicted enzyme related to lactoylglutathione lyase